MAARYRHLVCVVVGLIGMGLLGCAQQPGLVKVQAVLMEDPPRVSDAYVKTTGADLKELRLMALSRTTLERIIHEDHLYADLRTAEDRVNQLRKDVSIDVNGPGVTITYRHRGESRVAMKVAERLAGSVIDGYAFSQINRSQATVSFLSSQAEGVRRALDTTSDKLEREAREAEYRTLLAKLSDARLADALEIRQIGWGLRTVEAPHVVP